jgi:Sigma-70, region 4
VASRTWLPDQQRWAVVLHYVEDHPVAEVAAVLECSEETVKTHPCRARAALARRGDLYPVDVTRQVRRQSNLIQVFELDQYARALGARRASRSISASQPV